MLWAHGIAKPQVFALWCFYFFLTKWCFPVAQAMFVAYIGQESKQFFTVTVIERVQYQLCVPHLLLPSIRCSIPCDEARRPVSGRGPEISKRYANHFMHPINQQLFFQNFDRCGVDAFKMISDLFFCFLRMTVLNARPAATSKTWRHKFIQIWKSGPQTRHRFRILLISFMTRWRGDSGGAIRRPCAKTCCRNLRNRVFETQTCKSLWFSTARVLRPNYVLRILCWHQDGYEKCVWTLEYLFALVLHVPSTRWDKLGLSIGSFKDSEVFSITVGLSGSSFRKRCENMLRIELFL
jgi:hypothetical protein